MSDIQQHLVELIQETASELPDALAAVADGSGKKIVLTFTAEPGVEEVDITMSFRRVEDTDGR